MARTALPAVAVLAAGAVGGLRRVRKHGLRALDDHRAERRRRGPAHVLGPVEPGQGGPTIGLASAKSPAVPFTSAARHTWKPVTQLRLRQGVDGVRALYQKENRLESKVSLESIQHDPETNRAVPTLRIEAGPRIQVRTIGAKISQRKLQRYVLRQRDG